MGEPVSQVSAILVSVSVTGAASPLAAASFFLLYSSSSSSSCCFFQLGSFLLR